MTGGEEEEHQFRDTDGFSTRTEQELPSGLKHCLTKMYELGAYPKTDIKMTCGEKKQRKTPGQQMAATLTDSAQIQVLT